MNTDGDGRDAGRDIEDMQRTLRRLKHDLKTPLTATLGFLELLEDRPSVAADDVAAGYLARCVSAGQRMLAMIEALGEDQPLEEASESEA